MLVLLVADNTGVVAVVTGMFQLGGGILPLSEQCFEGLLYCDVESKWKKLPHCYFSSIFSFQKQRQMSDTLSGDKVISTVKYSDGLMLLAMDETVLQGTGS